MRCCSFLVVVSLASIACCSPSFAQGENQLRTKDTRSAIRVYRMREPGNLFTQRGEVTFRKASVDINGTIRADGHDLSLYGATAIQRNRICNSPDGARWACGQRAFIALRTLLSNRPITCNFKPDLVPQKAVCFLNDEEIALVILRQGWAELGDGITGETYIQAFEYARSTKVGVWADNPP